MGKSVRLLLCLALFLVGAVGIPEIVAADDNVNHSLFLPVIVKPALPLPQSHIPFSSDRARPGTGERQIWLMNTDGSDQRQLTDHELNNEGGKWSPDGQQILFTNFFLVDVEPLGPSAVPAITVMNADGDGMRRVTQGNPSTSTHRGRVTAPESSWKDIPLLKKTRTSTLSLRTEPHKEALPAVANQPGRRLTNRSPTRA